MCNCVIKQTRSPPRRSSVTVYGYTRTCADALYAPDAAAVGVVVMSVVVVGGDEEGVVVDMSAGGASGGGGGGFVADGAAAAGPVAFVAFVVALVTLATGCWVLSFWFHANKPSCTLTAYILQSVLPTYTKPSSPPAIAAEE